MNFSGLFAGLITVDIQYIVDDFPGSNRKIKTAAPGILVGGPATNAAVAFSVLNGGAILSSAVGKNGFSEFIQQDLNLNRIRFFDLIPSKDSIPVLASVITSRVNGDRNIFTHHPGAIVPEFSAQELIVKEKPQILLLDGFYPEAYVGLGKLAKEQNIPVVLDCGSWKSQYEELLPLAEVVICSADFTPPGCESSDDVMKLLRRYGVKKSAISRGGNSLLFCNGKKRGEVAVKKIKVKDSLGAGDFLHGAFCYYYLQLNQDFELALKFAVDFATFTCKFEGTRSWINNFDTSVMFLK